VGTVAVATLPDKTRNEGGGEKLSQHKEKKETLTTIQFGELKKKKRVRGVKKKTANRLKKKTRSPLKRKRA